MQNIEIPRHKFTDLLGDFRQENPTEGLNEWLRALSLDDLNHLERLLALMYYMKDENEIEFTDILDLLLSPPILTLNEASDMFLLAFRVSEIGKKRRRINIEPAKRMALTGKILTDVRMIRAQKT